MITIDTNHCESFVSNYCDEKNITYKRERLDVGDFMIEGQDMMIVIERKTWSDLSASICDGRWLEQKSRMNSDDNEKKTLFAYIIEGPLIDWNPFQNSKMNPKSIWGALIKAQLRDGFYVFHTADKKSTAEIVVYISKQINNFNDLKNTRIVCGVGHKRKRDNLIDTHSVMIAMLTVIPGMSRLKADAILKNFPTISDLQEASVEEISEIKCAERKVGTVLATTLKKIVHEKDLKKKLSNK